MKIQVLAARRAGPDGRALRLNSAADFRSHLPQPFRAAVEAQLESSEIVVAFCVVDLDDRLQFAGSLVALTSQRLVLVRPVQSKQPAESAERTSADFAVEAWPQD